MIKVKPWFLLVIILWECTQLRGEEDDDCKSIVPKSLEKRSSRSEIKKISFEGYGLKYNTSDYSQLWCAGLWDHYLQVDLGEKKIYDEIATQGGETRQHEAWVSSFIISHSEDNELWVDYRDGDNIQEFSGNTDSIGIVRNVLNHGAVEARYVRLTPTKFHNRICMRIGLFNCNAGVVPAGDDSLLVAEWAWIVLWILVAILVLLIILLILVVCYNRYRKRMEEEAKYKIYKEKTVVKENHFFVDSERAAICSEEDQTIIVNFGEEDVEDPARDIVYFHAQVNTRDHNRHLHYPSAQYRRYEEMNGAATVMNGHVPSFEKNYEEDAGPFEYIEMNGGPLGLSHQPKEKKFAKRWQKTDTASKPTKEPKSQTINGGVKESTASSKPPKIIVTKPEKSPKPKTGKFLKNKNKKSTNGEQSDSPPNQEENLSVPTIVIDDFHSMSYAEIPPTDYEQMEMQPTFTHLNFAQPFPPPAYETIDSNALKEARSGGSVPFQEQYYMESQNRDNFYQPLAI